MENDVVTQGAGQNIFVLVEDHQKDAVVSALKAVEGVYVDSAKPQTGSIEPYNDHDNGQSRKISSREVAIWATNARDVPLEKIQHAVDVALNEG
jgi:hypothetical protein